MSDTKVSSLTDKTSLLSTDTFYIVDPTSLTPSRKLTLSNLIKNLGPIQPFTPPIDANFSWRNQGGASVVTGDYGITMIIPSTSNIHSREIVAPSTPYTITAGFTYATTTPSGGGSIFGLGWANNAAGSYALLEVQQLFNAQAILTSSKWTSGSVFSAHYLTNDFYFRGPIVWMQASDDGANRIVRFSADGVNFITYHSVARTDFLTPDRVVWAGNASSASNALLNLVSWKQT